MAKALRKSFTSYFSRHKGLPTKRTGYRKHKRCPLTAVVKSALGTAFNVPITPLKSNAKSSNAELGNAYATLQRKITEAVEAKGISNSSIGFQRIKEPKEPHARHNLNLVVA